MIKAECNKGKMDISVHGDVFELLADTVTIINSIHDSIKADKPAIAEFYKHGVISHIETAFMSDDEIDSLVEIMGVQSNDKTRM